MNKFLIVVILLITNISFSQEIVEIIAKNDTLNKNKDDYFGYLFQETNLEQAKLVAKVRGKGKLSRFTEVFNQIKKKTSKIGANSFLVENYNKIDSVTFEIVLATYFCTDELLKNNFKNIPKNFIYVFGNENFEQNKQKSFKVNGEKQEISSGKYKKFEVKVGEELKINKGGFSGMTLWITGKEDKGSTFLSLTGLGLMGGGYNPVNRGMGITINTGRINPIEPNLGLLLLKIFEEQK